MNILQFYPKANEEISRVFHVFNIMTFKSSELTSFDPADYESIIGTNSFTVFGRSSIKREDLEPDKISEIIDEQVSQRESLLAGGFDVFSAHKVGAIVIAKPEVLAQVPMETLEHTFDYLNKLIGGAGTIFRGVYSSEEARSDGFDLLTIWSGVDTPAERLRELKNEADQEIAVFEKKVEAATVEDILGEIEDED